MKITEGYMPYLGYQTYYRIVGESRDGKNPLVLLHGGPGSTHNYFELLGQSFGGMLALAYVCDEHPEGVESLILSSTLPSSALWAREQHRMIRLMPERMQEAIRTAEETGNYGTPEYEEANREFIRRHCAPDVTPDSPECVRREKGEGREAYMTAWGPNEFTPLVAKTMYDAIPDARWELFENSRHMLFLEENGKYLRVVSAWMEEQEAKK